MILTLCALSVGVPPVIAVGLIVMDPSVPSKQLGSVTNMLGSGILTTGSGI